MVSSHYSFTSSSLSYLWRLNISFCLVLYCFSLGVWYPWVEYLSLNRALKLAGTSILSVDSLCLRQVPAQHVQFFYVCSHVRAPRNGHANFLTYFSIILKIKYPSTKFTLLIVYWTQQKQMYIQLCFKMRSRFASNIFLYLSKNFIFYFYISKELKNIKVILK